MCGISSLDSSRTKAVDYFKTHPNAAILAAGGFFLALRTVETDVATVAAKTAQAAFTGLIGAALAPLLVESPEAENPLKLMGLLAIPALGLKFFANLNLLRSMAGLIGGMTGSMAYTENGRQKTTLTGLATLNLLVALTLD